MKFKDRSGYIARIATVYAAGGWEFTGKIIDMSKKNFLMEIDGEIVEIKRKHIVGLCLLGPGQPAALGRESFLKPQVDREPSGAYHTPMAVARPTHRKLTGLERSLVEEAEFAKAGLSEQTNQYGPLLPDDMLESPVTPKRHIDLGITFGAGTGGLTFEEEEKQD